MKKILLTTLFAILLLAPSIKEAYANTVFPYKKEIVLSNQERTKEKVSFRNDSKKEISFSPGVYSYNPQTLELTDKQSYLFLQTDKEIFNVAPGETFVLEYEIVPPMNIPAGTYFNVITFQKEPDDSFLEQSNPVGVMDTLSHLVVMHITDSEASVYGITSEFAQVSLEIKEQGIPFIRPTIIKYVYQNITNYVLSPDGEIQIYNKKGSYSPIYLKINENGEKLYPGGILEEEFEIDTFDVTDLLNGRTIVGRFYNGIDDNLILKEVAQEPNYIFLSVSVLSVLAVLMLIKAIIQERSNSKKNSAKPA